MKSMTQRQRQILDYIKGYVTTHGFPPTIREISEEFGISVKGAYDHVKALERKEAIRCNNNRSRAIEVLDGRDEGPSIRRVPILGRVAAGRPIFSEENLDGAVELPTSMVRGGEHFALQVAGDSMTGAGIFDGDLAVVSAQASAENGQIVVAMVDDEAVTLKRFYRESNRVKLQSENPAYPPIYTQEVRILGRLAHVIRSYR
ncbi:MAG: transcriptional repressor LexA [Alkalispirochaetaceae bacterium]